MAFLISPREAMYLSNSSSMFSRLVRHTCSHITGEDEEMRVISLKPPAASSFISPFSSSLSRTRFTSDAEMTCGRCDIAPVI